MAKKKINVTKSEKWAEDRKFVYLKTTVFESDVYIEKEDFGHAIAIPKNGKEAKSLKPVLGLCKKYKLNPFEVLAFISIGDKIVGATFRDKEVFNEVLVTHSMKFV
jgi:hypothetical protein